MTLFQRTRGWWQNRPRWLRLTVMIVLGVLILGRLALPFVLKTYVNHQLSQNKNYGGKVGDISVHLWRGAYRIHDINIYKKSGTIHEPFFEADYVDLSIESLRLLTGRMVGQVYMMKPKINFEDGPTADQKQSGKGGGWGDLLSSLFPFDFNRLESSDGELHFYNHYSKPPVDLFMNQLNLVATNLSNAENQPEELSAQIQATAKTFGGGALVAHVKFSPIEKNPTFELTGTINDIDLTAANDFMQAYAGLQVGKGNLSTYASVASKGGAYDGYLKLFFKNLHLFDWSKERHKDIFQIFKDAVAGLATVILTNPNGNFATKLAISGKYGKNQVDTWGAVASAINNAFFNALLPKADEKITVKTVENKIIKKDTKIENKIVSTATPSPLKVQKVNSPTPKPTKTIQMTPTLKSNSQH
jgi:hypothetical protein